MTTPDRASLEASQQAWAHAQQAPDYAPECPMTHETELMGAHGGRPTEAEHVANGATAASGEGHGS